MSLNKILPLIALLALAIGCTEQPVAPDQEDGPLFQATHEEITTELFDDGTFYVECANDGMGEDLTYACPYTDVSRFTTSSSGNLMIKWRLIFDATCQATGSESEDVWTIDPRSNDGGHANWHGFGVAYQITNNEFYKNQDGDRLHLQFRRHVTWDADGNVKVFKSHSWCPGN